MTFQELQDLLRQDPGRWPLPVRLGVIGTFFVVFSVALIYFGVWTQKKDELAQFQNEEQTLRQEFKTKQAKAVNLELYRQQLDEIQKSFGTMLRQLPGATEMADFLRDVSQVGSQAGLAQERFKKLEEVPQDFYALVPIEIRLRGSYHQLGDFVSRIAGLPRIVTLHNVTIKQDKNPDQLQMDVIARTYRYLDEAEIAAAEAAKKKATVRGSSSGSGSE
jgi:type IV pilus assembly protein PilO